MRFLKQPDQYFPIFGDFDIIIHRSELFAFDDQQDLEDAINAFWEVLRAAPLLTPHYLDTKYQTTFRSAPMPSMEYSACLNYILVG